MPRRVFYSFHYQRDSWRASKIRNIGVVEGNPPATNNRWESIKRGGDAAIKTWIDDQLRGRHCTIVLVGTSTARRRWIHYEIEKTWEDGDKGVFGIRIHRLLDQQQLPSRPGANPFEQHTNWLGRRLSSIVPLYTPPHRASVPVYRWISDNIEDWIETAIAHR